MNLSTEYLSSLSDNKINQNLKLWENTYSVAELSEAYWEPSRTTKIDNFVEINKSFKPLSVFAENFALDVWLGS